MLGDRVLSDPFVTFDEAAVRGGLKEFIRQTVENALNALLEEEADGPEAYRAGYYAGGLTTASGQVSLKMPKRKGMRFGAAIIERYKRCETSVEGAMIEMRLAGVSTRRIEDARSSGDRPCRSSPSPISTATRSRPSRNGEAGC